MFMKNIIALLMLLFLVSCEQKSGNKSELKPDIYRAILDVQDDKQLPFVMEVVSRNHFKVYNAEEIIDVDEIEYFNDSIKIKMPFFEGYMIAKIENGNLNGKFIKESLDRIVPFRTVRNANRFDITSDANTQITGNWETVFSQGIDEDEYIAKGIFKQNGNKVTGTFRTTTGDYRYLEGVMDGNELKLSAFDGAHAFLFTATVKGDTVEGYFYSGNHWKEPFVAKRNETYELPDASSLTFLKEGYDKFEFSFPDENGKKISLDESRFQNKVVIVQIMGSWCPNCLDESRFYTKYYDENKSKAIEFVGLAFEYAKTESRAFKSIKRMKDKVGIKYPVLLAQYGSSDKVLAQEKLPMLNHVLSYPTSIFIDKKGNVRKIHTGFDGPATGEKYTAFKNEFETFIDDLLKE